MLRISRCIDETIGRDSGETHLSNLGVLVDSKQVGLVFRGGF